MNISNVIFQVVAEAFDDMDATTLADASKMAELKATLLDPMALVQHEGSGSDAYDVAMQEPEKPKRTSAATKEVW